uniref:Uncharacterized protein n=1 Tax=Lepeophtheirus salmonis TaxID=72036 RepID=A0A0K2V6L6_LEPSM|nr:uncharacterized protein LOC121117062 [Lepeophtheirus salmonis]
MRVLILALFLSTILPGRVSGQEGLDVADENSQDGGNDDLLRDQDPNILNPQNKQGYGRDIPYQVIETKPLKVTKKEDKKTIAEQTIQAILQFGVLVAVAFMVGLLFMLNIGVELAYERIKESVSTLCCPKRTIIIQEPDPAQLVGTFKRYK